MKTSHLKTFAGFFLATGFGLTAASAALDPAHPTVNTPPGIINPQIETTFFRALDFSSLALEDEQTQFLQLINEYRVQNGHSTLEINSYLQAAAQWHSEDMADKNYFSHTDSLGRDPFQRMADFGYTVSTSKGENIAAGYSTAASVFQGWKNSPGHNANMLNSNYRVIGIGLAYNNSSNYDYYWTTDFGGIQTDPVLSPTVTSTPATSATATPATSATATPATSATATPATSPTSTPATSATATPATSATATPATSPTSTPATSPTSTPAIKLEVYPNPSKGGGRVFFKFQGHEPVNALVEVRVFNISGNIISKFSKNIISMPVRLEWDTGNLASGIYLYKVYLNGRSGNSGKICVDNK
jgi:uncharacterized protein YkwD